MKKLVYILSLTLLAGCSGPTKSFWNSFRAHYNTHYNAKKSFQAGLKQVENQPVTVDPDIPVRVHREPNGAGNEHFASTIDKEVRLLRKFPDSKWTDDALFLIGKSYYYRKEFYLALQTFEELYALDSDPELKQEAVVWKGRTLLDLARHQDATVYLENELAALGETWNSALKAEAQVLLAEHYAMVANWESAAYYLNPPGYGVADGPFLGRTFFLYGQILEHLGQYEEAFFAYDQVSANFPDYEYIYWAEIKKGRIAREEGNADLALSIFRSMKSDDKNFERQNELDFEIAGTQELLGNTDVAGQIYNQMLYVGTSPLPRSLQAKVYYRLGKIYGEKYQNYKVAAAYFDSSSVQVANTNLISNDEDVEILASAYGNYAALTSEVSKTDSLLWLGSLSASELDSVIEKVREQKRRELQQQFNDEGISADRTLINIDQVKNLQENQGNSQYGFLNHRNQSLIADSKNKFRIVWGRRPLVDNWRRVEAVTRTAQTTREEDREVIQPSGESNTESEGQYDAQLNIDLSEIPTTEAERRELKRKRAETQYELGGLFFLTLDLPDSAAFYFSKVIQNRPRGELEAKSMYSLFELYHLMEQEDSSRYWGDRILQDYPNTVYGRRVSQRRNTGSAVPKDAGSNDALRAEVQAIEDMPDSVSLSVRAEKFRTLALNNRTSELAPYIHYRAIQDYVRLAKEHSDLARYMQFWQTNGSADLSEGSFAEESEGKEENIHTEAESASPFTGVYWDSVWVMIDEYEAVFQTVPHRKQLQELKKVLAEQDKREE